MLWCNTQNKIHHHVICHVTCGIDSKTLSAERREEMFSDICKSNKWIGWKVTILSPNVISNSMLKRYK